MLLPFSHATGEEGRPPAAQCNPIRPEAGDRDWHRTDSFFAQHGEASAPLDACISDYYIP